MSEIKTKVIQLEEGKQYTAGCDEYLISENHNLSDILRFVISQAGNDKAHVMAILETVDIIQNEGVGV